MVRSNVVQFPTAQKIEHYLSTQQAADFLNVSQPYLDELLSKGEIPFRRVGSDSLVVVKIKDVIGYKKQEDQSRFKVLEELADQAQELGMGYE